MCPPAGVDRLKRKCRILFLSAMFCIFRFLARCDDFKLPSPQGAR
jgi:hypothetical protein